MAYPDIGRGYRQNRRRRAAEKEETAKKSKKSTPRLHSPGARARAMSAAVGLDTSTDSPRRQSTRAGAGTRSGGVASRPKRKMSVGKTPYRSKAARRTAKARADAEAKAKARARPTRRVNDLSPMSETKVVGTRRPNQSQELKAKKAAVTTPKAAPKPPKIDLTGKTKTKPADMMRRESATAAGMVAEKNPKSIAEARRKGSDTFIGKDGRKKAAVTKEELEASGYKTLREYLNAKNKKKKKPAMKKGGNVAKYAYGGEVRGAGIAKKGVKPCKMR